MNHLAQTLRVKWRHYVQVGVVRSLPIGVEVVQNFDYVGVTTGV